MSNEVEHVDGHRLENILLGAFEAEASGDFILSIKLFKIASRLGSTDAMSKLGTIYDDILEMKNPKRAVYWYKKGFLNGDSSCAWNLAMHYAASGQKRWYLHWLRKAVSLGDCDANSEILSLKWWKKLNQNSHYIYF